jgi:hypothetical protein
MSRKGDGQRESLCPLSEVKAPVSGTAERFASYFFFDSSMIGFRMVST